MKRFGRTAFVWFSLLVVATGSRGIVLCTGAHGHVAIEPAGHCHGSNAACGHVSSGVASYRVNASFTSNDNHCEPCVDVPLSWGPVADGNVLKNASSDLVLPENRGQSSLCDLPDLIIEGPRIPPEIYPSPLSNIVLQV